MVNVAIAGIEPAPAIEKPGMLVPVKEQRMIISGKSISFCIHFPWDMWGWNPEIMMGRKEN